MIDNVKVFFRDKIKDITIHSDTKIAIFPFNKWSDILQDLLRVEKGIGHITYIDNFEERENVIKCSEVREKLGEDIMVFLCSDNPERYFELRTSLLKYVPKDKVIDVFYGFKWKPELVNKICKGGKPETVIFNQLGTRWDSSEEMLNTGMNPGNLIYVEWLKKNVYFDHEAVLTREWNSAFLGRKNVRAILPGSNFIDKWTTWYESLVPLLEKTDMRVSIAGLGAQASYGETPKEVVGSLSNMQKRFFYLISERSRTIGVRGEFSAECLNCMGIKNIDIIGCPSFYRYEKCYPKLDAPNQMKVLASLSSQHIKIKNIIERNRCTVIRQAYEDYSSGEIFFDFEEWNDYIKKSGFTFAFGSRFHGNMEALNNGIPTLWITHDWRTLELVRYLNLPYIEYGSLKDDTRISDLMEWCDYAGVYQNYPKLKANFDEYIYKNLYE